MAIFPKINGTTIRKEKRAAFVLSLPKSTEVEIVAPEREIPGNIAMACEKPITKALENDTFLLVFFALSAKYSNKAVIINIKPTNLIFPPKSVDSSLSKVKPIIAAGSIDTAIFTTNFVSSFHLKAKTPLIIS